MGISSLTLVCLVAAREAMAASRNRVALMRAEWEANGCLARAQWLTAETARTEVRRSDADRQSTWQRIDELLSQADVGPCQMMVTAVGSRLDINSVDEAALGAALRGLGLSGAVADSASAAIMDWIDTDDIARPLGAEATWYRANGLPAPPNRPLVDLRELQDVRRIGDSLDLASIFDVEAGAISLNHAPLDVMRQLPGLSREAAENVVELRSRGVYLRSFADLGIGLPHAAHEQIQAALPVLAGVASLSPTAWIVAARHKPHASDAGVNVEVRLEQLGTRLVIVRRKVLPI